MVSTGAGPVVDVMHFQSVGLNPHHGHQTPEQQQPCSRSEGPRPLGPAERSRRPPRYPTRCPHWAGFRWSQRAAKGKVRVPRRVKLGPSGLWRRLQRRAARRRGLFQLSLTLAERGITTGLKWRGTCEQRRSAPRDYTCMYIYISIYMAEMGNNYYSHGDI